MPMRLDLRDDVICSRMNLTCRVRSPFALDKDGPDLSVWFGELSNRRESTPHLGLRALLGGEQERDGLGLPSMLRSLPRRTARLQCDQ
jgi:hypothetical protein